ncbi:MAG: helix-turn-helix transcriptional regulator [Spirochaetia bacterium]|jgi:HTH-type transcriptional regulator/antitoxin HipB|nr:helix-turn-helix transcriptional regulator [Spirochaetia bacterium]
MSDLQKYIEERKKKDPEFAENYNEGYKNFKIGAILKQSRIEKGFTQEQLAKLLNTKKTAISRIENHAEDIRLSTLEKFVHALGKEMEIIIQ